MSFSIREDVCVWTLLILKSHNDSLLEEYIYYTDVLHSCGFYTSEFETLRVLSWSFHLSTSLLR